LRGPLSVAMSNVPDVTTIGGVHICSWPTVYSKDLERGKLATASFLGGDWNEYAQIVLSMIIADTFLNAETQLAALNDRLGRYGK